MRVLVTGATGNVGRALIDQLLAEDVPARASSRDPGKVSLPASVELAAGDLNHPQSMAEALQGVTAVFLYAQGKDLPGLMDAMKQAGVERIVFLSTIDVTNEHDYAQGNRRRHLAFEQAIAAAGFRYTFLRPGAFATNALRFWRRSILAQGLVRIPYPEAQQAPIDERDIAAVAARALTSSRWEGQALILSGPESLTQRQQVACISEVTGRPIQVEEISEDQTKIWLGEIVPPAYLDLLIAQWRDEVGTAACVTANVQLVTGRPAVDYASWAARNVDSFR